MTSTDSLVLNLQIMHEHNTFLKSIFSQKKDITEEEFLQYVEMFNIDLKTSHVMNYAYEARNKNVIKFLYNLSVPFTRYNVQQLLFHRSVSTSIPMDLIDDINFLRSFLSFDDMMLCKNICIEADLPFCYQFFIAPRTQYYYISAIQKTDKPHVSYFYDDLYFVLKHKSKNILRYLMDNIPSGVKNITDSSKDLAFYISKELRKDVPDFVTQICRFADKTDDTFLIRLLKEAGFHYYKKTVSYSYDRPFNTEQESNGVTATSVTDDSGTPTLNDIKLLSTFGNVNLTTSVTSGNVTLIGGTTTGTIELSGASIEPTSAIATTTDLSTEEKLVKLCKEGKLPIEVVIEYYTSKKHNDISELIKQHQ